MSKRTLYELVGNPEPGLAQLGDQWASSRNQALSFCSEDDAQGANHSQVEGFGTTPRFQIVHHDPIGGQELGQRENFGLSRA